MPRKTKPELTTEVRGIDLAEVERLLAFMQRHGLEEFEYARGGVHIRLKKPSSAPAPAHRAGPQHEVGHEGPQTAAAATIPIGEATPQAAGTAEAHIIKSPIVGTFYSAPSPDAEAFVTVGSRVEQGQVLCIIEAMKLMNEIESDVAGEVVKVYVDNGSPVEYGEALFGIRPAGKK